MKYQQLDNLETGWKWGYLIKKHREGEIITRHIERSSAYDAVELLLKSENQPEVILSWIENHMNPALDNRLKQAIRAKRKRYFNAEQQILRKKSIDLDFLVWHRLATLSQKRKQTLSETIIQLIDDAERKEKYENQLNTIKNDLQSFLKKTHEK